MHTVQSHEPVKNNTTTVSNKPNQKALIESSSNPSMYKRKEQTIQKSTRKPNSHSQRNIPDPPLPPSMSPYSGMSSMSSQMFLSAHLLTLTRIASHKWCHQCLLQPAIFHFTVKRCFCLLLLHPLGNGWRVISCHGTGWTAPVSASGMGVITSVVVAERVCG